jgi:hypothetical protein
MTTSLDRLEDCFEQLRQTNYMRRIAPYAIPAMKRCFYAGSAAMLQQIAELATEAKKNDWTLATVTFQVSLLTSEIEDFACKIMRGEA